MVKHIIILGSSYATGKRIALDYCEDDANKAFKKLDELREATNNEIPMAIHILTVASKRWKDVESYDKFFENIKVVKSEKEFIALLLNDRKLTSLDVAEYILSEFNCSHTKLEKLTYFCYADYLCKYNEKLFDDIIYAFKYGPVIKSVYKKYKRKYTEELNDIIPSLSKYNLPSTSRILISENGYRKLQSIDATIKKYRHYSAERLVKLTHKNNTPWTISNSSRPYEKITDKDIKMYHCFEET